MTMTKKITTLFVVTFMILGINLRARAETTPPQKVIPAVIQTLGSTTNQLQQLQFQSVVEQNRLIGIRGRLVALILELQELSRLPMNTPSEIQAVKTVIQNTNNVVGSAANEVKIIQEKRTTQTKILKELTVKFQTLIGLITQLSKL